MTDLKKNYDKLKAKYKLPDLKFLQAEFGIELKETILQSIVDGMLNVIFDNAKLIESIIFVDSGSAASHLYEASMINENKIDAFEVYKKLMSLYWSGKKAKIKNDEKIMSAFINECYEKWSKIIKVKLLKMYEVFEKEWNSVSLRESEERAYHG